MRWKSLSSFDSFILIFLQGVLERFVPELYPLSVSRPSDQVSTDWSRQQDEEQSEQKPCVKDALVDPDVQERREQDEHDAERRTLRGGVGAGIDVREPDQTDRRDDGEEHPDDREDTGQDVINHCCGHVG